jgi:hypothetical protein
MSDVPATYRAGEGRPNCIVAEDEAEDEVIQSISVSSAIDTRVTCEIGVCDVVLLGAGVETGGLAAGDDNGSEIDTAVALV